jgi:hypothetical protein
MDENPTDAKEQYELGNYYFTADEDEYDLEKAFYWFTKAAEQGYAEAQFELGNVHEARCDACVEVVRDAEFFKALGTIHDARCNDSGADQSFQENAEKMIFWLTKAAEQGHDLAQTYLFVHYKQGKYVPRNAEKMVYWLTKSAEQGNALSQGDLGAGYLGDFGSDVPKDKEKAVYWLTKAAEQGSDVAKRRLASVRGGGVVIGNDGEGNGGGGGNNGCYIATSVYGSYDCPQVWTLRRYRDHRLSMSWLGRRFIQVYYAVSPTVVRLFGGKNWFNGLCKPAIDNIVRKLQSSGIDGSPYSDV